MAYSYHCFMLVGGLFASINFLLIVPFISLLNSSINILPLYLLSLAVLQNFYMNSFIILPICFILLSSTTLTDSLSPSPNFFLSINKNSSADSNSTFSISKSSNKFFFHKSADLLCTYNSIHYICSYTIVSLILILKYNLHIITNSPTFSASLLNTSSLATFILDPILGPSATASLPIVAIRAWIYNCIATNCFCCCWMICL